jgi:hypothetical protein
MQTCCYISVDKSAKLIQSVKYFVEATGRDLLACNYPFQVSYPARPAIAKFTYEKVWYTICPWAATVTMSRIRMLLIAVGWN